MLTREEVMARLCKLVDEAYKLVDPSCLEPSDCFCGENVIASRHYQNSGHALMFVENAVRSAIEDARKVR